MAPVLATVAARPSGVYRVARRSGSVFAPPPWRYADPDDGTFGGRFDDPGKAIGFPEEKRFRIIYCTTRKEAAYAECLVVFRRSIRFLAELKRVGTVNASESVARSLDGTFDPEDATRGVVTLEWRMGRQIGHTYLDPSLLFVDIADVASLNHLRRTFAELVDRLGLDDLDLSMITSNHRALTQACARHIYEQCVGNGQPQYAGIRYLSRLGGGEDTECWAVFDDRLRHSGETVETPVRADDPDLLDAAKKLSLSVETSHGHYLRP